MLFRSKSEEIAKSIGENVRRGSTGLFGKGMYTGKEKVVLMCAIGRKDLAELKTIIKKVDPSAFMIITNSREVLGVGFKE